MKTKTPTKEENIFKLYAQLPKNGAMGKFSRAFAKELGIKVATLKNHYLPNREFSKNVTEAQKDWAINYLQNALNNK